MLLYEYKALNKKEQIEVLFETGVCISERENKNFLIFLYQINSFYVELFYNKRKKLFTTLDSFNSIEQLEPYLSAIDIDSALQ